MNLFKKTLLATAILATSLNVCANETEVPNLENIEFQYKLELIKKDIDNLSKQVVSNKKLVLKQFDINYKSIDDLKIDINALEKYVYNLPNTSNYEQVKDDLKEQIATNSNNISHWGTIAGFLGFLVTAILASIAALHFRSIGESEKKVNKLIIAAEKEQTVALDMAVQKSIQRANEASHAWLEDNGMSQLQEHMETCSDSLKKHMSKAEDLVVLLMSHVDYADKAKEKAEKKLQLLDELAPTNTNTNTKHLDATTTGLISLLKGEDLLDFITKFITESSNIIHINEAVEIARKKLDSDDNLVYLLYYQADAYSDLNKHNESIEILKEIIVLSKKDDLDNIRINDYVRHVKSYALNLYLKQVFMHLIDEDLLNYIKEVEKFIKFVLNEYSSSTKIKSKEQIFQLFKDVSSFIYIAELYSSSNNIEKTLVFFNKAKYLVETVSSNIDSSDESLLEVKEKIAKFESKLTDINKSLKEAI